MICSQIEELLPSYLDNELSPEEAQSVSSHLDICRECSALLASLRETDQSLTDFPEVTPSLSLLQKLYAIPAQKKPAFSFFEFFSQPFLQPLLAAASVLMMLFSLYYFNPNRNAINKAVELNIHRGYSTIERFYAKAESVATSLGRYKENIVDSVKNIPFFGKNEN